MTILVLLLVIATGGHARAESAPPSERQVVFVKAYVAAMQSKNSAAVMKLLHRTVRACVNDKTRAFYKSILSQQFEFFPSWKYKRILVTPVGAKSSLILWSYVPEKSFPYPVRPTHDLKVDFGAGPDGSLGSDVIEVAQSGAEWYWVTACPTAEGMKFMRAEQLKAGH